MTRALVFHADPRRPWLAARSVRNLKAAGIDEISIGEVVEGNGPVLLLEAGLVLDNPAAFRLPPGTGIRVGIGLSVRWSAENPWSRFHALHGGDYPGLALLPPPGCENGIPQEVWRQQDCAASTSGCHRASFIGHHWITPHGMRGCLLWK